VARRLAWFLGRHGRLHAERAADVVVVDEVVSARAGAGLVELLLDLGLGDTLFARNIGDCSLCHNAPQLSQTGGHASTRSRCSSAVVAGGGTRNLRARPPCRASRAAHAGSRHR